MRLKEKSNNHPLIPSINLIIFYCTGYLICLINFISNHTFPLRLIKGLRMNFDLKSIKLPDTLVLIFSILILISILTWFYPGGKYERKMLNGREVVQPDSYKEVESVPQGLGELLTAPIKGFVNAGQIIAFVLIVGGSFVVIQKTGAFDALINKIADHRHDGSIMDILIIPIAMILFSTFGSVFGMSEEVIPFILIFVPLAISLGYDSIVGAAIPFVGAGAGFAGAFLNPFTIGIAQGIADLPPVSGLVYRILLFHHITGNQHDLQHETHRGRPPPNDRRLS